MARKRMFDRELINQDIFIDLPTESKALYFLLGMEADDEGFVSVKRVMRNHGIVSEDALKILIAKRFLIPFKSGVVVITDWKINNYIDKNKIRTTLYTNEKVGLYVDVLTNKYCSLTEVKPKFTQYSIEENSIEENSIEYIDDSVPKTKEKKQKIKQENTEIELSEEWEGYIEMRKIKKKPLTERARTMILNKLEKIAGGDIEKQKLILDQSTVKCWTDVYDIQKYNNQSQGKQNPFAFALEE